MMLPLELWLAQSTELRSGSKIHLERVPTSKQSHILVQVRRICSARDIAKPSISGPKVLHRCHWSDESGLQGEFSRGADFEYAVPSAEQDEQTLLPSPRNSVEGHLALLESTSCNILVSPVESKVDHILSKRNMRHFNVEGLKELLRADFVELYEYNKTFEEAAQDPFIVIHTSGSTGMPKPIILYHGGVASMDNNHLISSLDGFDSQIKVSDGPIRIFTSLPPFHVRPLFLPKFISITISRTYQLIGSGYHTDVIDRSVFRADDSLAALRSAY